MLKIEIMQRSCTQLTFWKGFYPTIVSNKKAEELHMANALDKI